MSIGKNCSLFVCVYVHYLLLLLLLLTSFVRFYLIPIFYSQLVIIFIQIVLLFSALSELCVAIFGWWAFSCRIIPWLYFTRCPNRIDYCCYNENSECNPEYEPPFLECFLKESKEKINEKDFEQGPDMFADLRACTLWISGYTYIFRHPSNEWWCSNAGQCSNSIRDCHQWASIIWTQVQWINFHTGIECAHKTHRQCKPNDNQSSIATSIWGKYNAEGRNDGSYKNSMKYSIELIFATEIYVTFRPQILTNSREPFTCASNWAAISSNQVIAKETSRYGYHPHH